MKVIASSVIRSTIRGQSHGGLYVVDFDNNKYKQVLDWNYPHIRWDSGGGDRGIRGMVFYKDYLYAAGATYIYKFNKSFELVNQFNNTCFDGTHEMCIVDNILYSIANQFDAIWLFDLDKEEWIGGFQHILGLEPKPFGPNEAIQGSDSLHLDMVSYKDGVVWYAGSTTKFLYGFNMDTKELKQIKLAHPNTHNAQFWKDGIVFNRSLESDTNYQVNGEIVQNWPTPRYPTDKLSNVIRGDHARTEYTRGMAIEGDRIAVGTSPASVHIFSLEQSAPLASFNITNDIRNSVCGLSLYPWE